MEVINGTLKHLSFARHAWSNAQAKWPHGIVQHVNTTHFGLPGGDMDVAFKSGIASIGSDQCTPVRSLNATIVAGRCVVEVSRSPVASLPRFLKSRG